MSTRSLKHHAQRAGLLYEQRCQLQQQPLISAKALEHTEDHLMIHLHVLSFAPELCPKDQDRSGCFVNLNLNFLAGNEISAECIRCYLGKEETRQGAIDALCVTPQLCSFDDLQRLYQQDEGLRAVLFNLWRLRRDKVPAGLISAAELQRQQTELQVAALDYATSWDVFSGELFKKYYQGLGSGQLSNRPAGKLLVCAFRGMLLRGSDDFIKPLWRAIETEDDPETLIQLLEIGAIAGVYGIEDLIAQKSAQHPDVAARLLAIHGSKAAIDKLLQLPHREEHEVQLEAAWQWLSGKHLKIDPHLRLVQPESAEQSGSSRHWWYAIRPTLEDGQRLIFGQVMTAKLVESAIINWTGQFSTSLIPLLSWLQKRPVNLSAQSLLRTKRVMLVVNGGSA